MGIRSITLKAWLLLSIFSVGSATGITAALITHQRDVAITERLLDEIENFRGRFASVNSVHIVADANIAIYGDKFISGHGRLEYWAQEDGQYRTKCTTDKNLELNTDLDIAYDGERYQILDLRSRMLSFGSQEDFRSHIALPNPFFLPLDFLSIEDDDCGLCRLRFSDLKSQNERWKSRSRSLEVKSTHVNSDNTVDTVVEMPGGRLKRKPFKIRLKLSGAEEGRRWPVQVERIDLEGRVIALVRFNKFQVNDPLHLPREISISVFNDNGSLALRLDYKITSVEINQPLTAGTFKISFNDAEGIWDSNNRKFIKEKRRSTGLPKTLLKKSSRG